MNLNPSKGNMYEFITHTWNPVKGRCFHDCSYCYMKEINPNATTIRLVDNELTGSFPANTFIFIDSSADLFAPDVPDEWMTRPMFDEYWFDNREKCDDEKKRLLALL